jgi:hypothetical protein
MKASPQTQAGIERPAMKKSRPLLVARAARTPTPMTKAR